MKIGRKTYTPAVPPKLAYKAIFNQYGIKINEFYTVQAITGWIRPRLL